DLLPQACELPSCVTLELTEKGGHVGFVTGKLPWQVEYWLEEKVPNYLENYL
ncbi:MAG: hydrolase, partial [Gammaproteobacteria bacterium]|nr:hydrolase [Gammaproteobacteria bacterium]